MVDRIKELCKMNNLTIRSLEQAVHIGNGSIRRWDEYSPSVERASIIADYFGVTIEDLMGKEKVQGFQHPELELVVKQLNADGVKMLTIMAKGLLSQPEYKKSHTASALQREA